MGWKNILTACACMSLVSAASGQATRGDGAKKPEPQKSEARLQRERAIARCKANRGVDCETPAGLKEWIDQERPITDEERAAAAGARRAAQPPKARTP